MVKVDNLQLAVEDVLNHWLISTSAGLALGPTYRRDLLVSGFRQGAAPVEGLLGGAVRRWGQRFGQVGEVQEEVAGVQVAVHYPQLVHLVQRAEQLPHQGLRLALRQAGFP